MKELEPAVPVPQNGGNDDADRGLVGRGQRVIFATFALVSLLSWFTNRSGFRYAQNVVWPTDLIAFQHMDPEPLDVVILGSSRASFAFSPTAIDRCLAEVLGRETRTVNLSRVYSTPLSWSNLVENLLVEERIPEVLVVGIAAEAFNESHHRNYMLYGMESSIDDVPAMLGSAQGASEITASLAPIFRGVENLGLLVSGRFDKEERLRWLMLHQGGGQFCVGSSACVEQNEAFSDLSAYRWRKFMETRNGAIRAERFERYEVGSGIYHDNMLALLAWAERHDTRILFVNMPLHPLFENQIPDSVMSQYSTYVLDLVERYDQLDLFDANRGTWRNDEDYFLDPDHLGSGAALEFSEWTCGQIAPLLEGE